MHRLARGALVVVAGVVASLALGCGGKTRTGADHGGADGSASDAPSAEPEGGADGAGGGPDAPQAGPDGGPPGDGGCNREVPSLHAPGPITCAPSGGGDECLTSADCADAGFEADCVCSTLVPGPNACIASSCRVDADCGDGGYCSPSTSTGCSYPGCGGYHCHTCADQCVNDSDCASGSCGVAANGTWMCLPQPNTG